MVRSLNRTERTEPDAGQEITVTDLVSRLEPERRAAFVLTQMLGLSYRETAQVCQCTVGTVSSRVARARGDLVCFLNEQGSIRRDSPTGTPASA
jgi:RNA polymerase sigma-70 factor, ECF subfamily